MNTLRLRDMVRRGGAVGATTCGIGLAGLAALAVIAATGRVYLDTSDPLALVLIGLMAAAASLGVAELIRCAFAVQTLDARLSELLTADRPELARAEQSLQRLLRARLEGAPRPVRGAELTPYLVGVLVMLGLLGTFLGLFETMRGAHTVVAGSRDASVLQPALTSALTGLTRSFGTSAAGVCASAMLGLGAVLLRRRERRFDAALSDCVAGPLSHLAPARRREQLLAQAVAQGAALPDAAAALRAVGDELRSLGATWAERQRTAASDAAATLTTTSSQLTSAFERALARSGECLEATVASVRDAVGDQAQRAAAAVLDATGPMVERVVDGSVHAAKEQIGELRAVFARDYERRRDDYETRWSALGDRMDALLDRIDRTEVSRCRAADELAQLLHQRTAELIEQLGADLAARRTLDEVHWEQLHAQLCTLAADEAERSRAQRDEREAAAAVLRGLIDQVSERARDQSGQLERAALAAHDLLADVAARSREQLAGAAAAIKDQLDGTTSLLREQVDRTAEHTREQLAAAAAVLRTELEGNAAVLRDQIAAAAGQTRQDLVDAGAAVRDQLAASAAAMTDQLACRYRDASAQLEQTAEAARAMLEHSAAAANQHLTAGSAAVRELADLSRALELERHERALLHADAVQQHADGAQAVARALTEAVDRQRAQHEQLETRLRKTHAEVLAVAADRQRAYVDEIGACVTDIVEAAREATTALQTGSAELAAVAEMLTTSVDRHREAANLWLESLGAVDAAVHEAGENAAAEALAQQLSSTSELFVQQLEFHRELFEQLKSMRGVEVAAADIDGNGSGASRVRA
jgi:hypothetical protein